MIESALRVVSESTSGVGVGVGVFVGVGVRVSVGVRVGVGVFVDVGAGVAVEVGTFVGVGAGTSIAIITALLSGFSDPRFPEFVYRRIRILYTPIPSYPELVKSPILACTFPDHMMPD